tara:strand:+ start:195 stop:755 length:561 start_codon:yes stop_codon:yes gene_type:complete
MKEFEIVLKKLIEAESEIERLKNELKALKPKSTIVGKYVSKNISDIAVDDSLSNIEKVSQILEIQSNKSTLDISKLLNTSSRTIQRIRKSLGKTYKSTNEIKKPNEYKTKTYLIKNSRNSMYKIGRSSDPKKRERTLQSEEPLIKIVKTWDKNIESELHNLYKDFRVRGEWFNLSKVQVRYICINY